MRLRPARHHRSLQQRTADSSIAQHIVEVQPVHPSQCLVWHIVCIACKFCHMHKQQQETGLLWLQILCAYGTIPCIVEMTDAIQQEGIAKTWRRVAGASVVVKGFTAWVLTLVSFCAASSTMRLPSALWRRMGWRCRERAACCHMLHSCNWRNGGGEGDGGGGKQFG